MFNKIAESISRQVAKAWFFCACVLLVLLWLPSYFVIRNADTWQLIINTVTTVVTFLMVALLQNSQQQFEDLCIAQNRVILDRLNELESEL